MAFSFVTEKPVTVYIKNIQPCKRLDVFKQGLPLPYFFRILNNKFENIKFNICHPGTYSCTYGSITKIVPIEITPLDITLPKPDRNRMKPFSVVRNFDLNGTPARNFTDKGVIETGNDFDKNTYAVRLFILLHEVGHFYYEDETLCDLFAAKEFIKMGYNNSTAFYSLSNVLNCKSDRNKARVTKLFNNLNK